MNIYPDFSEQGYQVLRELGRNREGGRITWLASNIDNQEVVLKQFCFAQVASSWSGFEAHQREIQILQGLNHPGIPRYINSLATSDGFCLVQEYINAPSLAQNRSFTPEEIKQIAINALEILVYLQNLHPPLIHRDIKPENILVDEQLNVYLIDFGFARIGGGEVAGSSVFKGTPGFIPPEQMFEPTKATDLYALGTTLICLLTGIKSTEVIKLCDRNHPYLIKFSHLLPKLSLRFVGWLEKMVQPEQNKRFTNAQAALAALQPLDVMRVPGVDFSETVLQFQANRIGEKLTQSITVGNTIPDTLLQGRWEVAPHPNDPPHTPDSHAWISVTPAEFNRNHTRCQVQVDTSKLMADKQYKRQLILHSNAYPETHTLRVIVQTAALPIESKQVPNTWLSVLLLISTITPISITWLIAIAGISLTGTWLIAVAAVSLTITWLIAIAGLKKAIMTMFRAVIGAVIGVIAGFFGVGIIGMFIPIILTVFGVNYSFVNSVIFMRIVGVVCAILGSCLGAYCGFIRMNEEYTQIRASQILDEYIKGNYRGIYDRETMNKLLDKYSKRDDREWHWFIAILYLLTAALGTSFGIVYIIGSVNLYMLSAVAGTGLSLVSILLYPSMKRRKLIAKYRQSEEYLIKP